MRSVSLSEEFVALDVGNRTLTLLLKTCRNRTQMSSSILIMSYQMCPKLSHSNTVVRELWLPMPAPLSLSLSVCKNSNFTSLRLCYILLALLLSSDNLRPNPSYGASDAFRADPISERFEARDT